MKTDCLMMMIVMMMMMMMIKFDVTVKVRDLRENRNIVLGWNY